MQESVVLRGPIPPSGVVPVLQAVGIGRQVNALRIFNDSSEMLGQLWVRSGQVLAVEWGDEQGPPALKKLVSTRDGSFTVSTVLGADIRTSLGELRSLLAEAGIENTRVSLLRGLSDRKPESTKSTGVQQVPSPVRSLANPPTPPIQQESGPVPIGPNSTRQVPVALAPKTASSQSVNQYDAAPTQHANALVTSPALVEVKPAPAIVQPNVVAAPPAVAQIPVAPVPPIAPPAAVAPVRAPYPSAQPAPAPVPVPVPAPAPIPIAVSSEPRPVPSADVPVTPRAQGTPQITCPILAIASAKGGVGKTTIALNTAVALARRGMRIVLIDADPNGGVSAAVNAHTRRTTGAYDVLCGATRLQDVIVDTRMNGLRVVPAGGHSLSIDQIERAQTHRAAWQLLIKQAAMDSSLVIVDTAGGAIGPTRTILGCVSHVLGVLQAEPLAVRVSDQFRRSIQSITPPPKVIGIVVNMFDSRSAASAAVLQEACKSLPAGSVLDTPIPRTVVINDASMRGIVPGQVDLASAPAIAWTFEQLGAEVLERLEIERPEKQVDDSPLF